jgi:zinc protease
MKRGASLFLALAFCALGPSTAGSLTYPVQETVLDNGLKVLMLENRKSPIATFQVWYRVGSRNEVDGKSGLAHFLEHMMFKGTSKVAPEEHARIIARNGGRSNAFTSADATVYFATMSSDKIGVAVELEADRMANALLDSASFEAERKVVMEERRLRVEDRPTSALGELAGAAAYLVHPYRRPVIGWMPDLQNLKREDLRKFYRTYYVPNNAFIVAVGDFASQEMLNKIRTAFGRIPRGRDVPRLKVEEPPQRGERRVILRKEAELPFITFNYHAPNLKDPDGHALELLTVILASGRSSRLYEDLVYNRRLTRSVDANYSKLSIDPTIFGITAQLMPQKDPQEVERAIETVLEEVRSEPVSDRELEKARNQVEASFVFGQDSVFGQANRLGRYESAARWQLINSYLDGIRKVSAADVLKAAKRYLDPDRRTVGVLIPAKGS